MVRICPILNHPLVNGVLVEDDALVKFIQKRNLDFLANEFVCLTCKREIIKLYNKKLKKAKALRRSSLHTSSVSSLPTSNAVSSSSEHSILYESLQNGQVQKPLNYKNNTVQALTRQFNVRIGNSSEQHNQSANSSMSKILSVSQTSVQVLTSISNTHSILQENQINTASNNKTTPVEFGKFRNVTLRKKTIKDYLTARPSAQNGVDSIIPAVNTSKQNSSQITVSAKQRKPQQIDTETEDGDDESVRRLSQQPTTSKAVNVYKRPISAVVYSDDDDDDERFSLNAYNGTPLPHVQPIPPKRKFNRIETPKSLAREIMDEYIKDIKGG